MTDRLQDLIESGLEITGVEEYNINRRRGSVGIDFSLSVPRIEELFGSGSPIIFKGIAGIVTSKEFNSSPQGWSTVINGVSAIGELIRKAPIRTLTYMSMTEDEQSEFDVACESDYSNLDYIPLIRICDPITFTGGWDSQSVINDLALRAELQIECNVYNYWVRQVQASNSGSYYDTILSLVSFLRPIIYEQDNVIYLLERPVSNGSVSVEKSETVSQRYVFNFESKAKYFQVTGGYGQWNRTKSKIKAAAEGETTLESETYQEKPQLMTVNITGAKPVVDKLTGVTTYEQVGINYVPGPGEAPVIKASYSYWLKEPMRERYTTTEIWRLDPFGNFKALMSRHTIGYNITLQAKVLDSLEEYTYDFLAEEYDRPRLMTKTKTEGRYTWIVTSGLVNYRAFAGKVEEVSESCAYAQNGTLLQETHTKSMDVVKFSGGDEYSALDVADKFYRQEGSADTVNVERMVVEEKIIKYRQMTPDLYQRAITIRKLGPLARKKGEENYISTTEIVRGRVPRHPRRYRTMLVYCDNIDGASGTTDVPVITVSNPNIVDWTDACQILARIMQLAAEANVTERTLIVPGDIPVDIGWEIDLGAVDIGIDQQLPAISAPNSICVVAYTKSKNAEAPSETTTMVVEAK